MDLRKSTLRYLHSVFDDDPAAVPAVTIESDVDLAWSLSGTALSIDGSVIDLRGLTLHQVEDALRDLGLAATVANGLSGRHATTLLDDAGQGTRAVLSVPSSVLWSVMLPGALAQLTAQGDLASAIRQLSFMSASGGWLDLWGRYFDVPRLDGQSDAEYAAFIKREVLRPRSSVFAIQQAVADWTGRDIVIREPHKELFIWGKSRWDGTDSRWQDGNFYTFGTFEPRGVIEDWTDIIPVIQRNRALGAYMLPPVWGMNADVLTINPGAIPVAFSGLSEVRTDTVDAVLVGDVAVAGSITQSVTVSTPAARWTDVGTWDTRTWMQGTRSHDVGVRITELS